MNASRVSLAKARQIFAHAIFLLALLTLAVGCAANPTLKPFYKSTQATPPPEPGPESKTYPDWAYAASVPAKIVGGYHWGR